MAFAVGKTSLSAPNTSTVDAAIAITNAENVTIVTPAVLTASVARATPLTLVITIVSCVASVFGGLLIIVTYFSIPKIRNYIRKLLLYLTIANLLDIFGILVGALRVILLQLGEHAQQTDESYEEVCVFESFVTSFAPCASFFWTIVIAIYFHVQLLSPSKADVLSRRPWSVIYHMVCWGIPAFVSTAALFYDKFGEDYSDFTGPWCWIRSDIPTSESILWMFVTVKGWELGCYLITSEVLVYVFFTTYIMRGRHTHRFRFQHDESVNAQNRLRKGDKNFLFVWLVLYILRVWGTVRFLMLVSRPKNVASVEAVNTTNFVLLNLQAFGDTAQAFFNFIILCVCDKTIRDHYLNKTESTAHDNSENEAQTSGNNQDRQVINQ